MDAVHYIDEADVLSRGLRTGVLREEPVFRPLRSEKDDRLDRGRDGKGLCPNLPSRGLRARARRSRVLHLPPSASQSRHSIGHAEKGDGTSRLLGSDGVRNPAGHEAALLQPEGHDVLELRGARYHDLLALASVIQSVSCRHGTASIIGARDRSHRHARQLRAGELSVGDAKGELPKQPTECPKSNADCGAAGLRCDGAVNSILGACARRLSCRLQRRDDGENLELVPRRAK